MNLLTPLRLLMLFNVLPTLLLSTVVPLHAQTTQPALPKTPPNTTLPIKRQMGTCPTQIRLWTSFRSYEGGGEHTVIADTRAIATAARLTASGSQFVEFQAPLQPKYRSCVGQAVNQEMAYYQVRFAQGKVHFRVDLTAINKNPSTPTRITYKAILTSRPYVRWAIAD